MKTLAAGYVEVRIGKSTIVCRKEDAMGIINASSGTGPALPAYEKSAIVRKAIKEIKAENAEDLVLKALVNRKGLNTVFSGLNEEIRDRFHVDPTEVTNGMIEKKIIKGRPAKGSFWITL